ncbi:hypothetical protein FBULB1_12693 [Fusarium bulbicola]|nr:hypothetical protein FBULB1_12693 [Fusarium bulbicola]
MPLERADFVGAIWLTTPILVLLGSKTPRHLRWILLLPFGGFCLLVAFAFPSGPDIAKNYTFGTVFYVALVNFNLLVLEDPYLEHKWTQPTSDGKERQQSFHSLGAWDRIRWCFDNAFSTRGIGWNWRTAPLPPAPASGTSKTAFLRLSMQRILRQYMSHDIAAGILQWLTHDGKMGVLELDLVPRYIATACWWASSIAAMDIGYHVACMIGVSSGLFWTRIEDVYPVNGPWVECYTLSRFWNRTWHQNFRRGLQIPSRVVARRVVRAPRGSMLSRQTQSYFAFTLSGLYHWAAAKIAAPSESFTRTLTFFLLMPNILLLEDLVIRFAQENLRWRGSWWRIVGLVWTFLALTILSTGFVNDLVAPGLVTAFPALRMSPTYYMLNTMVENRG